MAAKFGGYLLRALHDVLLGLGAAFILILIFG